MWFAMLVSGVTELVHMHLCSKGCNCLSIKMVTYCSHIWCVEFGSIYDISSPNPNFENATGHGLYFRSFLLLACWKHMTKRLL